MSTISLDADNLYVDSTVTGTGKIGSPLSVPPSGLTSVTHDLTLTGLGTVGSPLAVTTPGITGIEVKEIDGSPDVTGVTVIKVSNGTLTDNGGGTVTVTTSGGGGGGSPGGNNTDIQYKVNATTFGGSDKLKFTTFDPFYLTPKLTLQTTPLGSNVSGLGFGSILSGGQGDIQIRTEPFDLSVVTDQDLTGNITIATADVTGNSFNFQGAGSIALWAGSSQGNSPGDSAGGGAIQILAGSSSGTGINGGGVLISSGRSQNDTLSFSGDIQIVADTTDSKTKSGIVRFSPNIFVGSSYSNLYPISQGDIGNSPLRAGIIIGNGTPPDGDLDSLGVGILYVQGGALKYRGSLGTVTTIAPA